MYESIIAFDADAHAETVAKFGPLKPYLIAIRPGHMSGINLGIKNGLNRGKNYVMKQLECQILIVKKS